MENNEINLFELDELPRYVEIAYKKLKNVNCKNKLHIFPNQIA